MPNTYPPAGAFAARSSHSGGVNVLLLDGGTRFVAESVDLEIWRAPGSRDAGESISNVSF